MTNMTDQQRVANYMGAIAHLLGGAPGRHDEFIDKVDLIVTGAKPHLLQLMRFTGRCRETGRPVLWVRPNPEIPMVPDIGLVALVGEQTRVYEMCMLWMSANGSRARLVPDGLRFGAYRFDDELRLQFMPKAPARSFSRAEPGMVRAYERLRTLEMEQAERGDVFKLPELAKAA